MAYDEKIADEIRSALSGLPVEEKKAFGGLAFMVNGKMAVSASHRSDHVMMVRIDPEDQGEALKHKGARVAVMRNHKMNGWIFLTEEAIKSEKDFKYWIDLALKFNKSKV